MSEINYQAKALRLLDTVRRMVAAGEDTITYTAYVLESFYHDGYYDAMEKSKPLLKEAQQKRLSESKKNED